jgi:hypothetical protein
MLQDVPPGLARDETLNADISSFILAGKHALFFREGFGHEPLYHYLGALSQMLLGDNYLAIRLPSAFLGVLLVAGVIRWVRREFDIWVALISGALLAVSWWPIIFSRIGLRPILEPVLLVGAAWFWQRRPWLAGLILGLTTYSYTAARVVLIIPLLFLIYQYLFRKRLGTKKSDYRASVTVLVIALLVYLPLAITLWADPSLQERLGQLRGPLDALQRGDFRPIIDSILSTLGVFWFTGDPLWSYGIPNRSLFDPLTGLIFAAGGLIAVWRMGKNAVYGFVLIWLLITLIPSAVAPDAPSLIRLIGAMPVVYVLPAIGLVALGKVAGSRWPVASGRRLWVFIGLAALVLLLSLGRTIRGGFGEWVSAEEVRQKYQSVWLDISRHWQEEPGENLVVADGWYEPVKADSLRRDYGHEVAARWVQQGRAIVFPAGDDADQATARFYVPEFAPVSPLLLNISGLGGPVFRSGNWPSYSLYEVPDRLDFDGDLEPMTFRLPTDGEPVLTLLGFQLFDGEKGNPLQVVTYWEVNGALEWDLSMFTHLVDENENLIAQDDGLDVALLTLQPADRFLQLHNIVLPEGNGVYTLNLGLYLRSDGQRLLHAGEPADRLIIPLDGSLERP